MPIYTARMDTSLAINTTIELDLKVTGQNIPANKTNFSYSLKIKKNNNYNDNFKGNASIWLNVGKNQILDGATSSWTIHGADHGNAASTSYTLKTGTFSVTHNSDGTKTANVSVLVDPNVSNAGGSWGTREQMRIEQSMVLTKINRNVSFTMSPSSTITLGNTLTVNVSGIASSNYHQAYLYVDGKSHLIGTRSGNGSISGRIPSDLVTSATAKTLSGSVRVFSYTSLSNLTSIGSPTKAINVYIPANAPIAPTVTGSTITGTGLNSGFMGANQHVSGKSVLKATVQGASAQSGSSINLYEVRIVASGTNTTIMSGTSTTSTVSLGTVPQVTPAAGQVADVITRVRDNRGIWSSQKKQSSAIRLHRYSTPSGSGTTKRSGTKAIVDISWSVTSIKEGGSTEKNSAKIYIDTKTRSSTAWSNKYANTSAALSGTYKATLTGYSTTASYDVRLRVVDALGTTTVNLNSLGTESVPLDVTQRGIGVGKIHSGSGANLQVGSGGIDTEGKIRENGTIVSEGRHLNYKTFTVGGNANSYYPVIISPQATFGFHRYSISRGYNWAAPNTWNTSTHRGGLTLDFEWSGDTNWGGNDKAVRVIEWNETYTTIVGGLKLARSGGVVVWLRGGGAQYRFTSERGQYAAIEVKLSGFTDASGETFPVRTTPVASEINNRYPVRANATLYDNGNKVWHTGNDGSGSGLDADLLDGKHASTIINEAINGVKTGGATTGAVSGRGRWFQTGDLLICTQVAFINGFFSAYSLTGSWTYPKAFAEAPFVQVAGGHNGMSDSLYRMNGELSAYNVTSTGTSVHYAGGTFASGNSKRVYMLAIGRL